MKNMNLTFISIQTIDAHPRIAGQEQSAVMVKHLVGARLWDSRLIVFSLKGAVGVPIELLVGAMVRAPYFYSTGSQKITHSYK
jgi:hypothetical protein